MLRDMTCRQLADWRTYYAIEPWGEWRADLRMGILACAVVAPHTKKGQAPKPLDFMPDFDKKAGQAKQTPEQQAAIFKHAAAVWGKPKK